MDLQPLSSPVFSFGLFGEAQVLVSSYERSLPGQSCEWDICQRHQLKMVYSAAILCLVITISNLITLLTHQGHEIAWVCLTACSLDICGNCLVMFWLTLPKFRRATWYATSASISTGICRGNTTKTYQLSASSSLPSSSGDGLQTTPTGDSPVHRTSKHGGRASTGGVLSHLWRADVNSRPSNRVRSNIQDPEIESQGSLDERLPCQDDIDIALAIHPHVDTEESSNQAGTPRV